ncbi:MAG TPA: DNA repair protein RecO, partial [Microbacteriaceae bacterium]|nr:DNA repair protein RecO [Microbacteriaceae bacterium]
EPFMVADLQLYRGRSLDIVTQAVTLATYGTRIAGDYRLYTVANSMAEVAARLTEAAAGVQQYLLLVGALRSLSRGEHDPAATLDSYLLRALSVAGWAPSFDACARCGAVGPCRHVVVQMGGAVCDACAPPGAPRLDEATVRLLGTLLAGDWAEVDGAGEQTRQAAGGIVSAYAQWHMEKGLRSLRLVDRRPDEEAV